MAIDREQWTSPAFCEKFMTADQKLRRTPIALTDADIAAIDTYTGGGASARRAREDAQRTQLESEVQQRYDKAMRASALATQQAATVPAMTYKDLEAIAAGHCPSRLVAAPAPLAVVTGLSAALTKAHRQERAAREALEVGNRALEARVAALEAHPEKGISGVRWAGTFELGHEYHAGELCTRGGLWLCTAATTTKAAPGSSPDWRLIVTRKLVTDAG